jgi:hypothetical protein
MNQYQPFMVKMPNNQSRSLPSSSIWSSSGLTGRMENPRVRANASIRRLSQSMLAYRCLIPTSRARSLRSVNKRVLMPLPCHASATTTAISARSTPGLRAYRVTPISHSSLPSRTVAVPGELLFSPKQSAATRWINSPHTARGTGRAPGF